MKIHIDGQRIALAELRAAWLSPTLISIGKSAVARIEESNAHIASVLAGGEQVYGVNTGFGQLAQVRISDDELAHLQENLVRSHAVGVGEDLPDTCVRLIMILKVIALARGCSGVRLTLVEGLCALHTWRAH
jgi:histidine ammonia-lyase